MKGTKNRTNHGFATCDRFYIQKIPHKRLVGSIFVYVNLGMWFFLCFLFNNDHIYLVRINV